MRITLLSFWLCVVSFFTLVAQDDDVLRQDLPFFQSVANQQYQNWLENEGLGNLLKVRAVEVDDLVSLYLEMPKIDQVSVPSTWRLLKQAYEDNHAFTLEQALFYKMANLFEVNFSQAKIRLNDTYIKDKTCWYVEIDYFRGEDALRYIESPDCQRRHIEVDPSIIDYDKLVNRCTTSDFQQDYSRNQAFELIERFAENYFNNNIEKCHSNALFRKTRINQGKNLIIEFKNVCKFVFDPNSIEADIKDDMKEPGTGCDFFKRMYIVENCDEYYNNETITLFFAYKKLSSGVRIEALIDGKFKSKSNKPFRKDRIKPMLPELRNSLNKLCHYFLSDLWYSLRKA